MSLTNVFSGLVVFFFFFFATRGIKAEELLAAKETRQESCHERLIREICADV